MMRHRDNHNRRQKPAGDFHSLLYLKKKKKMMKTSHLCHYRTEQRHKKKIEK